MIFEQPLSEHARLCLRLEYLFTHLDYYFRITRDDHQTIKTLLEILQTIDRPDLKNKFLQNLIQYQHNLSSLEKIAGIDKKKLEDTLKQLDVLINELHSNQKKIGQELRENEFLNSIQQRIYTPAGTCGFNIPAYQLWLQLDSNERNDQLGSWLDQLSLTKNVVELSLKLIRESNLFKNNIAHRGFYQCNLDPNVTYQIIRIALEPMEKLFPEISVGRYRLAIHFFILDINGGDQQSADSIEFKISCCKV